MWFSQKNLRLAVKPKTIMKTTTKMSSIMLTYAIRTFILLQYMLAVKYLTFMEIDMESDFWKVIGSVVLFFAMMFGALSYSNTLRTQCKLSAIEKGYTAVEIQAICGIPN